MLQRLVQRNPTETPSTMTRARGITTLLRGPRLAAIGLATAAFLTHARAQAAPSPRNNVGGTGGRFGLGLSLGDVMGPTLKLFLHPNHALQWDIGWMPLHHGGGGATMSYLWAPGTFVSNSVMDFFGYLGAGFGFCGWVHHAYHLHHDYDAHRGGGLIWRIPVLGLAFHWKGAPFDTAVEGAWSPMMPEWHDGHAYVSLPHGDFSIKGRYYF
jgi:hypothetical protein